jgi:tRNA threonylcarbamoyladenosine biosynthesis protein TsaE
MSPQPTQSNPDLVGAHEVGILCGIEATRQLAGVLAAGITPGFRLYLSGDLGTGKTTLVRELLRALGYQGRVASPTFALIEPYNLSKFDLHHFDFYRLTEPDAWRDAGFEESFDGRTVVVVEWPEHAGSTLPAPDLLLALGADPDLADDQRRLDARAHSARGQACLTALRDAGCFATAPSQDSGCAALSSPVPNSRST